MKLVFAIFYTSDIKRISDFYSNIPGFKKESGDDMFATFQIGEANLGIKSAEEVREIPGHQTIAIEVEDVDALYASLKSRGVTVDKELSDEEWGRNFSVLDPDSNKVEFFQQR